MARPRTLALDGLRGLACAAILVLHVWMFDHGDAHTATKGAVDVVAGELRLGVALFFVLSGFLIYRPFVAAALDGRAAPRLGRYALRRAARILPGYWAAVLGSFALLTVIDHPYLVGLGELPRFLLFAQNQSTETLNRLDPPLWTLAVEASFYVLVPVVGLAVARLGRRHGAQAALAGALLGLGAALAAAGASGGWPETVTTSLLGNLTPFAAGALAAVLLHGRRLECRAGLALAGAGVALVLADGAWHGLALGPHDVRALLGDLPACLGFAALIAALAGAPLRAGALTRGPLAVLGTLSFGIYLWHFPVIYALRALDRWPSELGLALTATLAPTLALAAISWLALERPALRWASRRVGSPTPRRAPAAPRGARPPAEAAWAAAPGRT
jgi:peptidoglycan/LPS O-acetylase OafA/YrhL